MTLKEAIDRCMDAFPGTSYEWHKQHIQSLVVLGVLKLDDMKLAEEYEQAIKAREIIDGLEMAYENTGLRRQGL